MLKLSPILRDMRACHRALLWVDYYQYKTFKEAWENVPSDENWHFWVIQELWKRMGSKPGYKDLLDETDAMYRTVQYAPDWETVMHKFFLSARVRKTVEQLLVQYAHTRGCAVEVSNEATIDAHP